MELCSPWPPCPELETGLCSAELFITLLWCAVYPNAKPPSFPAYLILRCPHHGEHSAKPNTKWHSFMCYSVLVPEEQFRSLFHVFEVLVYEYVFLSVCDMFKPFKQRSKSNIPCMGSRMKQNWTHWTSDNKMASLDLLTKSFCPCTCSVHTSSLQCQDVPESLLHCEHSTCSMCLMNEFMHCARAIIRLPANLCLFVSNRKGGLEGRVNILWSME